MDDAELETHAQNAAGYMEAYMNAYIEALQRSRAPEAKESRSVPAEPRRRWQELGRAHRRAKEEQQASDTATQYMKGFEAGYRKYMAEYIENLQSTRSAPEDTSR